MPAIQECASLTPGNTEEILLAGGNINPCVMRVGNTVRRNLTSASPTIHQLLLHLEAQGFNGSPRFLGIDEKNREVISYIEGATDIPASIWQRDEPVIAAARLLRQYHDVTVDFIPHSGATWAYVYPDIARRQVICHNDFAPYNFIYRAEAPVAVVDFDLAGPGPRLRDIAYAAYWLTPLSFNNHEQITFAEADVTAGGRRLKLFCDSYGCTPDAALLEMIDEVLAFMGNEANMREVLGAEAATKLRQEGHLVHWQRERACYRQNRARIEASLHG